MGLVSWSGALLTQCVVSYCLGTHHGLHWCRVVLVHDACWLVDWLDGPRAVVTSPTSIRGWLSDALWIVHSHGVLYPMMDLYYTHYVYLSCSMTPPTPVVVILSSWYYGHWMFMFIYDTIPTSSCIWIMIPTIVEVTDRLMWPLVTMYKYCSSQWTPRLSSLVFFNPIVLPIPTHTPTHAPPHWHELKLKHLEQQLT